MSGALYLPFVQALHTAKSLLIKRNGFGAQLRVPGGVIDKLLVEFQQGRMKRFALGHPFLQDAGGDGSFLILQDIFQLEHLIFQFVQLQVYLLADFGPLFGFIAFLNGITTAGGTIGF